MEEHPIGIAMIPSASDKEKDKMAKIAERYFGETEETRERTLKKLKYLLLVKNHKVGIIT